MPCSSLVKTAYCPTRWMQPASPRGYGPPGRPFGAGCAALLPAGLGSRAEPYSEGPGLVKTAPQLLLPHLHALTLCFCIATILIARHPKQGPFSMKHWCPCPGLQPPTCRSRWGDPPLLGASDFSSGKWVGKKKNLCPRLSRILLSSQMRVLCVNYSRKHGTFCNKGGSQAKENAQPVTRN